MFDKGHSDCVAANRNRIIIYSPAIYYIPRTDTPDQDTYLQDAFNESIGCFFSNHYSYIYIIKENKSHHRSQHVYPYLTIFMHESVFFVSLVCIFSIL